MRCVACHGDFEYIHLKNVGGKAYCVQCFSTRQLQRSTASQRAARPLPHGDTRERLSSTRYLFVGVAFTVVVIGVIAYIQLAPIVASTAKTNDQTSQLSNKMMANTEEKLSVAKEKAGQSVEAPLNRAADETPKNKLAGSTITDAERHQVEALGAFIYDLEAAVRKLNAIGSHIDVGVNYTSFSEDVRSAKADCDNLSPPFDLKAFNGLQQQLSAEGKSTDRIRYAVQTASSAYSALDSAITSFTAAAKYWQYAINGTVMAESSRDSAITHARETTRRAVSNTQSARQEIDRVKIEMNR